jgi:hypothetical protein
MANASSADAAGLFGDGSVPRSGSPRAGAGGAKVIRRVKLYNYDSVASQVFNPYGPSNFTGLDPSVIFKAAAKGNKKAAFHTELAAAADDQWRIGVGVSPTAQSLLAAIEQLNNTQVAQLLNPDILKKATDGAKALKPHLEPLDFGKGS